MTGEPFTVLQPHALVAPSSTYLPARPDTVLWGRLPSPADRPALTVEPGARVVIDTVSHEGIMPDQGGDPLRYFGAHGVAADGVLTDTVEIARSVPRGDGDGPHVVTGPVHVRGAMPGDLLAVRVERLDPRVPYGVISSRHGRGVLQGRNDTAGTYSAFVTVAEDVHGWGGSLPLRPGSDTSVRFPLAPFLGVMGVTSDHPERRHSVPPGLFGGNLDLTPLTVGATLFLPVQIPGAGFYVGDPHYAQGDGEVALTALEAPLRAELTVDLIPAALVGTALGSVTGPFAAARGFVVPTGLSESLDEAMQRCTGNAVELVVALFGMDPRSAYLYLSAATDFSVTQAVDIVQGVHARIRVDDFPTSVDTGIARLILTAARA